VLAVEDKLRQRAEITCGQWRQPARRIHDGDMYAAIDMLMDKIDRQVLRHKG